MDEERRIPDLIQWDQGLLLTPRHFLELAGRYERLQQETALLAPFGWGIRRFQYNEDCLKTGKIEITRFEAIMPDGSFIDATQDDIKPLQLDEKQMAGKTGVWLAIPARKDLSWDGESPRYRSVTDGNGSHGIDRIRPILTLHTEKPPRVVAMPLFLLERSLASSEMVSNYAPPWLSLPAGSPVIKLCSHVASLLRGKVDLLVSQIGDPEQALAGVAELRGRLRSVAGGLPVLEAYLNAGRAIEQYGHPFHLYQALCAIAGHVAILGDDIAPPEFLPYEHLDQLASFERVVRFIETAVNRGISENWVKHPFTRTDDGFRLTPNEALRAYQFDPETEQWPTLVIGLEVSSDQTRHTVLEWGRRCLIASGDVSEKRLTRVIGAARHEWANPSDLTPPASVILFAIARGDKTIDLTQDLHLIGGLPRPKDAILYIRDTKRHAEARLGESI